MRAVKVPPSQEVLLLRIYLIWLGWSVNGKESHVFALDDVRLWPVSCVPLLTARPPADDKLLLVEYLQYCSQQGSTTSKHNKATWHLRFDASTEATQPGSVATSGPFSPSCRLKRKSKPSKPSRKRGRAQLRICHLNRHIFHPFLPSSNLLQLPSI